MKRTLLPTDKGYLFRMTMPIFLVQLMQILVNNIDQVMISTYSQTAVAAIGNANQISWVLMLLFTILSTATVILVSQYKGAGMKEKEQVIYPLSMAVNIIAGLVIGIVCIIFGRQIFTLMNVEDPEILEYAYQYLAITGGGFIFMAMIMTYSSFFRSNSMMKLAMFFSIIINILNVIGNWLLIYGVGPFPELGVRGVAISTVISRIIGAILLSIGFKTTVGGINWKLLRPFPKEQFRLMLSIGVPSAGEGISYDASQLVLMSFINTLGLVAVNTKIYISLIVSFCYLFSSALSETTQVAVGYFIGAKNPDRADRQVWKTLLLGSMSAILITSAIYFASDPILSIFLRLGGDVSEELIGGILKLGKNILLIEIFLELGRSFNIVFVRCLQTAGDIKFPVIMSILFSWIFTVGLGYVLGIVLELGLIGIWLAMCGDELIRGIILMIRWKKGGWRKINLIDD